MPELALRTEALSLNYGGVAAVDALTLQIPSGQAFAIIGPNGAGKSSLVNLISGARRASAGRIHLFGEDITTLAADERARRGIGRTFQIPRPFARMTVRENLLLSARHARGAQTPAERRDQCDAILLRCGLGDVAQVDAGRLPLLRRKRLELARALALRPRLLLLDEIGAGLIERETEALIELILKLKSEVESIVLIEHIMDVVRACCESTAVLAAGRLLLQGATRSVLDDAVVAKVYLGATARTADRRAMSPPPAAPMVAAPLLTINAVSVNYGGVRALRGVNLHIHAGEVVCLLGANGAGKTTLANAISGAVRLQAGSIRFAGQLINGLAPERVQAHGVSHCMEGRRIFASLSVEENLRLAAGGADRAVIAQRLAAVYQMFPVLFQRRGKPGTAMSGGQQQMLAIARALMAAPKLIIFDEISLGLAPLVVEELYGTLARVRERGVAMLLVEQDIERGLQLADRAYVLAHGEIRLEGAPAAIRDSPALRELYVGAGGGRLR